MTPLERTRQYADDVLAGREIAGPHVRNACKRLIHDLEHAHERGLWFDEDAAGRAMWFFENVLQLPAEGQFDGKPFNLHPSQAFKIGNIFGWKREDGTRRFRRAYIEEGKGNGKPLDLETPIPTPSGWARFGDLKVGDEVFDEYGKVCRIIGETPVMMDEPCYRMKFSDGEEIIAGSGHLWKTSTLRSGGKKGTKPANAPRKGKESIRTTKDIAETLTANSKTTSIHPQGKWNHRVSVSDALDLPDADLPLHPFAFGAWLGDGTSASPELTYGYSDRCHVGI